MEPRISGINVVNTINLMGYPFSHKVEAHGFKRGIWMLWKNSVKASMIANSLQFIHLQVIDNRMCTHFITCIYAYPQQGPRKELWDSLEELGKFIRSYLSVWVGT